MVSGRREGLSVFCSARVFCCSRAQMQMYDGTQYTLTHQTERGGERGARGGASPTTSSLATADELDPQGLGVGAETTQTGGVANYQLKHLFFLTFFVRVHAVRTGSCQLPSH